MKPCFNFPGKPFLALAFAFLSLWRLPGQSVPQLADGDSISSAVGLHLAKPLSDERTFLLPAAGMGEPTFDENFWTSTLEAGYEVAFTEASENNTLRFNVIQTLHFNQEVGLGLGVGYRDYGYPLFANLRLVGELQKVSFVLEGSAGYTFEIGDPAGLDAVGLMFNPRVGLSFPLQGNKSWQLMVGYTFQGNALVRKQSPLPSAPQGPLLTSKESLELIGLSVSFNL